MIPPSSDKTPILYYFTIKHEHKKHLQLILCQVPVPKQMLTLLIEGNWGNLPPCSLP